jgi:hypothetical protein
MKIASTKGEIIWVATQADQQTINFPTSSGTIALNAPPEFTQKPRLAENKEMVDSFAAQPQIAAGMQTGNFKISLNLKASGSPGQLSPIHPLLYALYGRFTQNSGVDVQYNHYHRDDDFIYLTFLVKKQFDTILVKSARIKKMEIKPAAAQILTIDFTGFFMERFIAGTSTLDSTIDGTSQPVTGIPLDTTNDPEAFKRYNVGSYIYVGTDDNTGAGFKVTAINEGTNTLTIADGVTTVQNAGVTVAGFTPAVVKSGENTTGSRSWVEVNTGAAGSRKIHLTEGDFSVENGTKALEDIMDDAHSTTQFAEDTRTVNFNLTRYWTQEAADAKYHLQNRTQITAALNIGNEPGKIIQISMPNWQLKDQNESGQPEKKIGIQGQCFEDSGDDESTLILK